MANSGNSSADSEHLTQAKIDKQFLSRWLTIATRVVRVYFAISKDSEFYLKVFILVE